MGDYLKNGHGVGEYGGDYVRIPVMLISAVHAWFDKLGVYNKDKKEKIGEKVRGNRTMALLYIELYCQWVNANRQSKKGENEPFVTNYPELYRSTFIERHTAYKLLKRLSSLNMIKFDDSMCERKKNRIELKIWINMEERDKMMQFYKESP